MNKQLKTMSIDELLKEVVTCDSESSLNKVRILAGYELDGQDNITQEVVLKVIHYKQHVICNDKKAFAKLLGIRHWDFQIDTNVKVFTENADYFFRSVDIPFVIDILNGKVPHGKADREKLEAAKEAFSRFALAYQQFIGDGKDLADKKLASYGSLISRN